LFFSCNNILCKKKNHHLVVFLEGQKIKIKWLATRISWRKDLSGQANPLFKETFLRGVSRQGQIIAVFSADCQPKIYCQSP